VTKVLSKVFVAAAPLQSRCLNLLKLVATFEIVSPIKRGIIYYFSSRETAIKK
jgi:hypothetical protein